MCVFRTREGVSLSERVGDRWKLREREREILLDQLRVSRDEPLGVGVRDEEELHEWESLSDRE